jgi:arylsulfatase A-like enzyme
MLKEMRRREFLATLAAAARPRGTNIVMILADDLGWAELGCYGNRFNETPHLDKLAARGVRFTSGYAAAPVCSPTRASLMTGLEPARVGITDYLRANDDKYLSPERPTIAKALAAAGYRTGLIGKWHLMGDYRQRKGDPKLHGFDEVICSESRYIGPGDYFHPYAHMPEVEARRPGEYLTDRLNQEAVDFIRRNRERPFFLCLCHYAPHTRLAGKPELVAKYAAKPGAGKKRNHPELAAMLESIDEGIGMITGVLDELDLAGRTAVVFLSDNGGDPEVTSNAPLRGAKSMLYEGGIRVPLIVAAPGFGKAGSVCETPVTTNDLYPTFLELAGVRPRPGQRLDGAALTGALRGDRAFRTRALHWHYPLEKPHFLGGRSAGAIRQGDFKLIEFFDDGTIELYNLKDDPGETTNLAARMPVRAAALRRALARWRSELPAVL